MLGAIAGMVAVLLFLAAGARAEGTVESDARAPILLPVVCAHSLGTGTIANPACSSPTPMGAIHGIVYIDVNEDGRYDPTTSGGIQDLPVEGAAVQLRHAAWSEPLISVPSQGYYCFEGLEPGDYTVAVELSVEDRLLLSPLDDDPGAIRLLDGDDAFQDFRYARWYQPPPGPTFTLHLAIVAR